MVDKVASNFCRTMQGFAMEEKINVGWKNGVAIISLCYGLPLICLNMLLVIMLLVNRKRQEFSSPFYALFIITTILETFWWIFSQLADRLANATLIASFLYKWIPEKSFINTLIYFSMHYFMHAVMIITVCLALNRLITLVYMHDTQLWRKIVRLLAVFVIPIIFTWQLWFNNVVKCKIINFKGNNEVYYIILKNDEFNYGVTLSLGNLIVCFVSAFISLILNTISIIYLVIKRKKISNKIHTIHPHPIISSELKLFILTLFMFINQMVIGIIQVIFYINTFNPNPNADKLHEAYRFAKDVMCLTPSLFLILMSKNTRKEMLRILKIQNALIVPVDAIGPRRIRSATSVRSFRDVHDGNIAKNVNQPSIIVTPA